jgi:hypothetical protein
MPAPRSITVESAPAEPSEEFEIRGRLEPRRALVTGDVGVVEVLSTRMGNLVQPPSLDRRQRGTPDVNVFGSAVLVT